MEIIKLWIQIHCMVAMVILTVAVVTRRVPHSTKPTTKLDWIVAIIGAGLTYFLFHWFIVYDEDGKIRASKWFK